MKYYMPIFNTYNALGIAEISQEYFKELQKDKFSKYLFNRETLFVTTNKIDGKWEQILNIIINERNGQLLKPEGLFPQFPDEIFEVQGKTYWYLNESFEFVCSRVYRDFEIIKTITDSNVSYIDLMNLKSGKGIMGTDDEEIFQVMLRQWIKKNKMRSILKN